MATPFAHLPPFLWAAHLENEDIGGRIAPGWYLGQLHLICWTGSPQDWHLGSTHDTPSTNGAQ